MATVPIHKESTPMSAGGPRASSYDVVVVGAGMGGLTAGALVARAGKSVLVVEAEQQPGGNARALRDGPYTFDLADHLIMGCEPDGPFGAGITDAVLRHLGVRDRCDFVRVDAPVFEVRFPGFRLGYPAGREAYLRALADEFPQEAEGLRRLVDPGASMYGEWLRFPMEPRMRDLFTLPWRSPKLFRYRNATMAEVIDRELRDPRAKAAYAGLSSWMALPPARATFAMWSFMMAAYIEQGAYYCRGSFQVLADAVAEALKRDGGELLLGTRVTRVIAPGRRVEAVELEGGERINARQVIAGVDARETFGRLLERYVRRLKRGAPSEASSSPSTSCGPTVTPTSGSVPGAPVRWWQRAPKNRSGPNRMSVLAPWVA
jgi:phytoene dehydrogenase-like protein